MPTGWGGLNDILRAAEERGQPVGLPRSGTGIVRQVGKPQIPRTLEEASYPPTLIVIEEYQRREREPHLDNPAPEPQTDNERRSGSGTVRLTGDLPPLPVHRPMVDPVVALKKETARLYDFTPQATEELYRTPVRLYIQEQQPESQYGNWAGLYWGPAGEKPGHISVWDRPNDWTPSYSTLAHEYGHKWQSENMPTPTWEDFLSQIERARETGSAPLPVKRVAPNELYAEGVASRGDPTYRGGYQVDASMMMDSPWLRYYAGLVNSAPPRWPPPSPNPVEMPDRFGYRG